MTDVNAVSGTLFIVSTPIGNLGDMTYRAVDLLRQYDIICEDTRRTRKLLNHYSINVQKLTVMNEFNEKRIFPAIIERLKNGQNLCLVTDGGTPVISDPGFPLVREAVKQGITVRSAPGPSSPIAALTVSGMPCHHFIFLGFLSKKTQRRCHEIKSALKSEKTVIFLESPYRLMKTLRDIESIDPAISLCVCRELTKLHETHYRGAVSKVIQELKNSFVKGEFVIVMDARTVPDALNA